tara:strand:- start:105 stop:455 length:351 start_codon:yes stop_codon:yes gene_type:complete
MNREINRVSGLKIIENKIGFGRRPVTGQTLLVHYHGTLEDGKVFSSSIDRGQPFEFIFGKGNVIPGWDEGFKFVKEGGKSTFIIPPHLAYKDKGSPDGSIPPNATITFNIELLEVK